MTGKRCWFVLFVNIIVCLSASCSSKSASTGSTSDDVIVLNRTAAETQKFVSADSYNDECQPKKEGDKAAVNSNGFEIDADYDIKDFIRKYYDYMVSGDYELAAYLTNNSQKLSKDTFLKKSEHIQAVKSLTCYMMDGMIDGTYIVVAVCGVETDISSDILTMIEAFYICTNESGTIYICGNSVSDEVMSYNSIMLSNQTIAQLVQETAEENERIIADNEELEQLRGIIVPDGMFRFLYEQTVEN